MHFHCNSIAHICSVDICFSWTFILTLRPKATRFRLLSSRALGTQDFGSSRDVGDGWAGWAIAHTDFGRSVNSINTVSIIGGRFAPTLLVAHPALGSFLLPKNVLLLPQYEQKLLKVEFQFEIGRSMLRSDF